MSITSISERLGFLSFLDGGSDCMTSPFKGLLLKTPLDVECLRDVVKHLS